MSRPQVPGPRWDRLMQGLGWQEKSPLFDMMGFKPHSGQIPIHADSSRYRILCCGRRFGKSTCAAAETVVCAILGGHAWAVAPTYELASIVFGEALRMISESPLQRLIVSSTSSRSFSQVVLATGGRITAKSSNKEKSLLGRGNDLVVFDEASKERNPEIWHRALRPTLADRRGSLLCISTPSGDDWFKELFDRGESGQPGYRSWQLPTAANPLIHPSEIAAAKLETDLNTFEQEWLAIFLDATGAVFRGYRDALRSMWQDSPRAGGRYAIGVDVAKYSDFTVITVIDLQRREVCHVKRFHLLPYAEQVQEIRSVGEQWNGAPIVIDATGVGDAVAEALSGCYRANIVDPFVFTASTKSQAVTETVLAIQQGSLKLLARDQDDKGNRTLARIYANEVGSYRYERTTAGNLVMNAPVGRHDDCVTSLVLAWHAASNYGHMGRPAAPPPSEDSPAPNTMHGTYSPPQRQTGAATQRPKLRGRFGRG